MGSKNPGGDAPRKGRNPSEDFEEDPPRQPAGEGHNSAERLKALNERLDSFCKLQQQEDALMEKYIKPVRDKKNEVKADTKKDFEIPTKAFNARATLRMIELEDDDEVVLATKDMFEATPVGQNLDFVKIAENVAKKKAEKAAAAEAKKTKAQHSEAQV